MKMYTRKNWLGVLSTTAIALSFGCTSTPSTLTNSTPNSLSTNQQDSEGFRRIKDGFKSETKLTESANIPEFLPIPDKAAKPTEFHYQVLKSLGEKVPTAPKKDWKGYWVYSVLGKDRHLPSGNSINTYDPAQKKFVVLKPDQQDPEKVVYMGLIDTTREGSVYETYSNGKGEGAQARNFKKVAENKFTWDYAYEGSDGKKILTSDVLYRNSVSYDPSLDVLNGITISGYIIPAKSGKKVFVHCGTFSWRASRISSGFFQDLTKDNAKNIAFLPHDYVSMSFKDPRVEKILAEN